ncbi:hypothetical protein [Luxibacter massiliensis]|uniref:hypothetical protein n=1 Tax=Luxibacter massiliensis TaxID=2219695 RepID=UPI0013DFB1C1|nr:hypothetical protein [Luxibacter massiliensis]
MPAFIENIETEDGSRGRNTEIQIMLKVADLLSQGHLITPDEKIRLTQMILGGHFL